MTPRCPLTSLGPWRSLLVARAPLIPPASYTEVYIYNMAKMQYNIVARCVAVGRKAVLLQVTN